jgi:hypothetical protein
MKPNHSITRWAGIVLLTLLAGCQSTQADPNAGEAAVNHALAGKAVWEEKCRTVAGEKIYRKVENVEGLLLMKVRPERGGPELADRMWPGAAFAREYSVSGFISTFLGYEYGSSTLDGTPTPVRPDYRGFISPERKPGGLPGYRWVEVIDAKDGQRYRYTTLREEPWKTDSSYSKSYVRWSVDRTPSPSATPPRYGVTYEDHVIPEDRYLGIASSTIKVIDLQTQDVLGEMTRYAWSPGAPSRVNPSPWLTAYRCPDHARDTGSATRKFVDQVLIPAKEK